MPSVFGLSPSCPELYGPRVVWAMVLVHVFVQCYVERWVYRGPDGSIVAQMGLSLPGWVYRGPDGSVVARYLRKWFIIDTV